MSRTIIDTDGTKTELPPEWNSWGEMLESRHRMSVQKPPKTYVLCDTCGHPVAPSLAHNGVAEVWHYVHCGYGHDSSIPPHLTVAEAHELAYLRRHAACRKLAEHIASIEHLESEHDVHSLHMRNQTGIAMHEDQTAYKYLAEARDAARLAAKGEK